jgi:hypothetical protein
MGRDAIVAGTEPRVVPAVVAVDREDRESGLPQMMQWVDAIRLKSVQHHTTESVSEY